jgi:hypothetical protein
VHGGPAGHPAHVGQLGEPVVEFGQSRQGHRRRYQCSLPANPTIDGKFECISLRVQCGAASIAANSVSSTARSRSAHWSASRPARRSHRPTCRMPANRCRRDRRSRRPWPRGVPAARHLRPLGQPAGSRHDAGRVAAGRVGGERGRTWRPRHRSCRHAGTPQPLPPGLSVARHRAGVSGALRPVPGAVAYNGTQSCGRAPRSGTRPQRTNRWCQSTGNRGCSLLVTSPADSPSAA